MPTATVSPSGTRISVTVPLVGAGTSESTLSVDTSNKGSSACTCSPTCLSHRVIVPSVTVSPSWGMVTSTRISSFGVAAFGVDVGTDQWSGRPVSESADSPNSSLNVGWGCTSAAMSAAFASQLTER